MGLWDESTTKFPEACEKLVHAVMDKIPIKENNHILDVGYGCGDSSFLFADFYQCKVTGITNEAAQWEISQKRLETQYNHLQNRITFVHGSADTLDTIVGQQCFDHVISIDSAYHYCTRWDFLRRAYQHLKPDGSIGLFDLTLHPQLAQRMTPTKKWFLAVLCRAIGIPVANLVVADEYRDRLFALGYKDVNIESIDRKRVFGGLVHALKTQHERCHIFNVGTSIDEHVFMAVVCWMFGLLASHRWLTPVLVSAKRSEG
ncbi:hypothetical protein DFQ28_007277 [Apophysomyces sp. BC1034]|nr:hypothetical protein DFQ28_007277 [Apophysomyces sp. BC1034]